jgi:hypothetical protein
VLVRATATPFHDTARALLEQGLATPDDVITMRHAGLHHTVLEATVGKAARLAETQGPARAHAGLGPARHHPRSIKIIGADEYGTLQKALALFLALLGRNPLDHRRSSTPLGPPQGGADLESATIWGRYAVEPLTLGFEPDQTFHCRPLERARELQV